jgi:DNA-binding IscR family transcriptional regulator
MSELARRILDILSQSGPLTTSELAAQIGVEKSVIHKIVVDLRRNNLISFAGKNSGWMLRGD